MGEKKMQCDKRCYDAKAGSCLGCVCQGENHGVGRAKAMFKTRALAPAWAAARKDLTRWTVAASVAVGHREEWSKFPLFELPKLTRWVPKENE
jgi:hypothetical protein